MPLHMPEAEQGHLSRSPLSLVSCQVRHDGSEPAASTTVVSMLQQMADAGFAYDRAEQVQAAAISIEIGASSSAQAQGPTLSGWRLVSGDGRWVATIMAESFALETTKYVGWLGDFRERFGALLGAVVRHCAPGVERRLGLRYVDLFTSPPATAPTDWSGRIEPSFLGPIMHPVLGSGVVGTQQQVNLNVDETTRSVVRHGAFSDPARDGTFTYLLDTDTFRETMRAFDAASVLETVGHFHDVSLQLFQQFVTAKMLDYLRQDA